MGAHVRPGSVVAPGGKSPNQDAGRTREHSADSYAVVERAAVRTVLPGIGKLRDDRDASGSGLRPMCGHPTGQVLRHVAGGTRGNQGSAPTGARSTLHPGRPAAWLIPTVAQAALLLRIACSEAASSCAQPVHFVPVVVPVRGHRHRDVRQHCDRIVRSRLPGRCGARSIRDH